MYHIFLSYDGDEYIGLCDIQGEDYVANSDIFDTEEEAKRNEKVG